MGRLPGHPGEGRGMSDNPLTAWVKGDGIEGIPAYKWTKEDVLIFEEWERCRLAGNVPPLLRLKFAALKLRHRIAESAGIAWFQRQSALAMFKARKDSVVNGAVGGSVANLTGDEKALHLAKSIRRKSPCLSDREVAGEVKRQGGSTVSNGVESLRKKIAAWVKVGKLPAKIPAPIGKPKTRKKIV